MRKLTTKDFVEKATKIHCNKYDYSSVEYVNNSTKVCIICKEHGEFWQTPNHHLKGQGCPVCGRCVAVEKHKSNTKQFVSKSKLIHGTKYNYDETEYVNSSTKVKIICPVHGEFWQKPKDHLLGKGCPKCCNNYKLDRDEFIRKAVNIHGSKYDYSKTKYINNNTKICITCPTHGAFYQTPKNHLLGKGCPNCKGELISQKLSIYNEGYVAFHPIYGFYVIKKRLKDSKILVRFLNNGFEKECSVNVISSNKIKNPLSPQNYGVGFLGENYRSERNITGGMPYRKWCAMLFRCYNDKNLGTSYKDCQVCEEWHNFSNFKKWFDENYVEGWELDKDLFSKENKIYSPQTCCFLPVEINRYLASLKPRGKFLLGVCFDEASNNFKSFITINGISKFLGRFKTEEEAHQVYRVKKREELKRIADKYKHVLDERIYNAIINKDF